MSMRFVYENYTCVAYLRFVYVFNTCVLYNVSFVVVLHI